MKILITINRQFGSGGREIGKRLADVLQCSYYDRELISKIAEETGYNKDYVNMYDETYTRSYSYTFNRSFISYQQSPSDKVQLAYSKIIKNLAEKGNSIFIGRCADSVLHEKNPLKIFIYSSNLNNRIERCYDKVPKDRENITKKQMEKKILKIDKERAKYYDYYTQQKWDEMSNYNLCIDTSKVDIKGAVEIILSAIKVIERNCVEK